MPKQKVVITEGLPASGKTTFANDFVSKHKGQWINVNCDDIRAMFGGYAKSNEKLIRQVRDNMVIEALKDGKSVIVSDTNIRKAGEKEIRQAIYDNLGGLDIDIEVKVFTTPLEECIERDLKRPNSVGKDVIKRMYREYFKKAVYDPLKPAPIYQHTPGLPCVILCDIDGTLAHMVDRDPYEWHRVGEDTLDESVYDILSTYAKFTNHYIVLLSGRDSVCVGKTDKWLSERNIKFDCLYMRAEGDQRDDRIVKRELFEKHILGKYNVLFVLDDRQKVVDMWRGLGLKCLQVEPGDF